MEKKLLRKEVLITLKSQPQAYKSEVDSKLLEAFIKTKAYQNSCVIATYLSFDYEYNTQLLIKQALCDGKRVLVPKTYPKDNLRATPFGLLEPVNDRAVEKASIDLIHVPGLIFNNKGFRIGYGAGYFDRYLSDFEGDTISTIYRCQRQDFVEEKHDVAVKEVLCL
ncbi:TPA: 5-formyltetrahydrofolate cyclo-ligase [Streptococcus agalactiae]|nr:5-formyltetrahydrofolate cyclo-ligase [Streptococcus agalactiae]